MRQGSAKPIAFTLAVCAVDRPRLGAFAITRLGEDSWRVLPTRFIYAGGRLVHDEVAIHEALGEREMLALTHAPADVDAELETLSL